MTYRRQTLAFLLLLSLLATACAPRSRGNNGSGGDDDDSANDDDAVGDDDDDGASGTQYTGTSSGYLKSSEMGGDCSGDATIYVDEGGYVTAGTLTCGATCVITFAGPYAWSEESFTPNFDCSFEGYTPDIYETSAYLYGSENSYVEGNISGYGDGDYFSLSFTASLP